jgi:hypothetical protein
MVNILISDEDKDLLQYKWYLKYSGGAANGGTKKWYWSRTDYYNGKKKSIRLHRTVLERLVGRPLNRNEHTDHINGDTLDNRRENLRIASASENGSNRGKQKNNTSGYKGVRIKNNKYAAYIVVKKKQFHLGTFENETDAAKAYNIAAAKYFGSFAKLNEI